MSASWFIAFAGRIDNPSIRLANAHRTTVLRSQSGHEWIIADATFSPVVHAEVGARRLALIGETDVNPGRLAHLLRRHEDIATLFDSAAREPGSFHIVYTDGSVSCVQGSASGVRQVFFARLESGVHAISDSPSRLAQLTHATPRIDMVAWSLLSPSFGYGITHHTHWTGVERVPADERLTVRGTHVSRQRWWTPPGATTPIDQGAVALKRELDAAIHVRLQKKPIVSADLSGGLDSTSLCFLLHEHGAAFWPFVEAMADPNHDDARWATEAARHMGRPLTILSPDQLPHPYDHIWSADGGIDPGVVTDADEPYSLIRNHARKRALSRLFASSGSTSHISGFGGDELFTTVPAYLNDLFRESPIRAIRQARHVARLRRWKPRAVLAALASQQSYPDWFAEQAMHLDAPRSATSTPLLSWGPPVRLPHWATAQAADFVREIATERASHVASQAPDRATHLSIAGLRIGGQRLGPLRRLMENSGVSLSVPYMDDRVVRAALAIARRDAVPGTAFKPALVAAMQSVRTGTSLTRSTKGEFSAAVYHGLSKNRHNLLGLFEDSLLAQHGLIDLAALRSSISDSMRFDSETIALEQTIAAEVWLRTISQEASPATSTTSNARAATVPIGSSS